MPDPFDFFKYLGKVEADPRFKALPFEDQVGVRLDAMDTSLGDDPRYTYMEPGDYAVLRKGIALRPPMLETPELQSKVIETQNKFFALEDQGAADSKVFEDENPFWQRLLKGAGAAGPAFAMGGPLAAAGAFLAGKAPKAEQAVMGESARSQLQGVMKATGFFGIPNNLAKWAPKVFYEASKKLDAVMGGRESPVTRAMKANVDAINVNQQHQRDWDKWEKYTDLLFSDKDQEALLSHGNLKKASTFAAQMAELYAIPNRAMSAPFDALARNATSPAVRSGLAILRGGANLAAESGMELVRQYAIDFNQQTEADPQLAVTWDKTKQLFGEKVVGNVVGKTLFNGARILLKSAKHVIKAGGILDADKHFVPLKDLEDQIRRLTYSQGVSPEVIRNAGSGVEAGVKLTNDMNRVGSGVQPMTEETALKVMAYDSGYSLLPKGGGWDLVDLDRAAPAEHFTSWEAVRERFSKGISNAAQRAGRDLAMSVAAADKLQLRATPEYLMHLAAKQGIPIEPLAEDGWKVGGVDFPTSVDAAKALIKDKIMPDGKLSADLAPDMLIADDAAKVTNYVAPGVVRGPTRDILKHLEGFSTGKIRKTILETSNGGRIEKDDALNLFYVHDPDTNFDRYFQSSEDAMRWLNAGDGHLFKLKGAAAGKGYKLSYDAGHYVLQSNEHVMTFTKAADLRAAVKRLPNPDPDLIPGVMGLGDVEDDLGMASGAKFNLDPYTKKPPSKKPFTNFNKIDSALFAVDKVLLGLADTRGLPPALAQRTREVATATELTRKETSLWTKAYFDAITPSWSKGGHALRKPENVEIYNLIRDAKTRDEAAKALADVASAFPSKNLNPNDWLEVYDRTRKFYGETPSEGIGGFNLIGERAKEGPWILGYTTKQFRNYVAKKGNDWWGDHADMVSIAKEAGVREEHLPWFRHARADDIAEMAADDPVRSTVAMIRMSMRQKYFNPAMDAFEKEVNAIGASGKFDATVIDYLKHVEGLFNGKEFARMDRKQSSEWIQRNIIAKMGLDPRESKTLLDAYMSLGYNAAVGFNGFKILRNGVEQPFTVLAGKVGMANVMDTYREFAKDPEGFMKLADSHGVLSGGGEAVKGGGASAMTGMKRYIRMDDVTRAVAYQAARKPISIAIDQLNRGVIKKGDLATFLRSSKLRAFQPAEQYNILAKLNGDPTKGVKPDPEGAIDLYARVVTADTMVPMWRALRPDAIRKTNTPAKLLGHFGTYSFSYANNIKQAIVNGTLGDKLSYAANFAAGTAMLIGAAEALGVRPDSFNPLQPLGFTMGPVADMGINLIKGQPFATRYESKQARAKLLGLKTVNGKLSWDVESLSKSQVGGWMPIPGWVQMKALSKLPDYLNKKQYYRALIHVLGAPTNPAYFGDTK